MGIRRHTDDRRVAPSTNRTSPAGRAKTVGVVERWKEQLAAGEDLTGTREPSINDETGRRSPPLSRGRDVRGLSDFGVLIGLVILSLVSVLKLVESVESVVIQERRS
jgi:hypothetical protein